MPRRAALCLCLLLAACADAPAPETLSVEPDAVAEVDDTSPVIYEVFVRSFTPEGTFRAMIPRLDGLKQLGVDVLWLMPIHPVGEERKKGTLGSPYAIRDYKAVNPRFGTMDDFRALVDAVHARDMRIIIDLVANHTAWDHAWVAEHPEWYTHDASGAIIHPANTDWTDVADLNYDDPGVRTAMREAMRFWVEEVGIDGYRCDVADLVPMDFWREAIAELESVKPVLMLAEGSDPELHDAGFDLNYAWDTYAAMKAIWRGAPADTLFTVLEAERERYGASARMRFTTNHDETAWDDTPLALFGGTEGAQAAAVVAATLPGAFLVYNGQEVGDPQRIPLFEKTTVAWGTDPAMRAFYADLLAQRDQFDSGILEMLEHDAAADVLAYERYESADAGVGQRITVNVRNQTVTFSPRWSADPVELAPYEWRIDLTH
ncbi:MAG: alpha-amylase family glycosyl hydrolase [Bacteroidota bacterium]